MNEIKREKYINLFTDFGFKRIFGTDMNKELLIDFLNELLKGKEKIKELTYLQSEQIPRTEFERKAIYDLYCENENGEKFIVELQKARQNHFKDRSIFYSTFAIQNQAIKGDWNYELKAVYTIGILDFIFDKTEKTKNDISEKQIENLDDNKIVTTVKLLDVETNKVFYDKLSFIYIEVPKFKLKLEEIKTHFEKWLYAFKFLHQLQKRPPELQEAVFNKLFETAEISKLSVPEYTEYEHSLKSHRDYKNTIDCAKEEGKEEKSLIIATNMLNKGITLEVIAECVELNIKDLKKLLKL